MRSISELAHQVSAPIKLGEYATLRVVNESFGELPVHLFTDAPAGWVNHIVNAVRREHDASQLSQGVKRVRRGLAVYCARCELAVIVIGVGNAIRLQEPVLSVYLSTRVSPIAVGVGTIVKKRRLPIARDLGTQLRICIGARIFQAAVMSSA